MTSSSTGSIATTSADRGRRSTSACSPSSAPGPRNVSTASVPDAVGTVTFTRPGLEHQHAIGLVAARQQHVRAVGLPAVPDALELGPVLLTQQPEEFVGRAHDLGSGSVMLCSKRKNPSGS